MASATLSATSRTNTGKGAARSLRRDGQIPAVIYGHAREPQALTLDAREFGRLLEHVTASTVIDLALDGASKKTLIREIQRHPFKRHVLHVDFQELVAGETITVEVPLIFRGTAPGVREGGILDQVMHSISIEADPTSIPDHIDVDVSGLTLGKSIHVADLTLPAGVTVLDEADATVAVVSMPKVQAETVEPEVAAAAEPELIRKPKGDEGAEA